MPGGYRAHRPRSYRTSVRQRLTDVNLRLIFELRQPEGTRLNEQGEIDITRILYRYLLLCETPLPLLTEPEWCAVFDAIKGVWMHPRWHPHHLYVEVLEAAGLERWKINRQDLAMRLYALPFATCLAIVDAAERWWASDIQSDILEDRHIQWQNVVNIVGEAAIAPPRMYPVPVPSSNGTHEAAEEKPWLTWQR
jgi:hypothetical protein